MAIWPISIFQQRAAARQAAAEVLRARTGNSLEKPSEEVGVTGTVNTLGYLQTENNPALAHELGLGRLQTWGEYEWMARTDPAIAAALEMTVAPIRDASIEVEPADDDDKTAIAQAEYLRDNLVSWAEPGWPEFSEQVVGTALTFGFNLHEPVFATRADDRVPGGQGLYVAKFAHRLPASLITNPWVEADGELAVIRQQGYRNGNYQRAELPASQVLLWTWGRTGSNYAGYSHLRSIYGVYRVRRELLKIIGIGAARESLGVPLAEFEKDAPVSAAQLKTIQTALENLTAHENAAFVAMPGMKIQWLYSPAANKGHVVELYERLGTIVSELFFAQGTKLGTNGTGSRAVGSVHADTQLRFVQGVVAMFEGVLNGIGGRPYTGIGKRVIDANWGPQKAYPRVRITLKRPDTPVDVFATALSTLVQGGVITITGDLENQAREKIGVAPIDPAEREEEQQKKQERALAITAAKPPPEDPEGDGPPPKQPKAKARLRASDAVVSLAPSRALRPSEMHLAVSEMDTFMNTARADFERDMKDIVAEMVRRSLPNVRKALKDHDPSAVARVKLDDAGMKSYVEGFIEKARAFGAKQVRAERKKQPKDLLKQRRQGDQTLAPTPLKAASSEEEKDYGPETVDRSEVVDREEKVLDGQKTLLVNRISNRVRGSLTSEAIDVVSRGGDVSDIVDNVADDVTEGKQLRTDAGQVLTRAFSVGREQAAAEFGSEIAEVERSAILDANVCEVCADKDGETADFNSDEHDALLPPDPDCDGAPQCRCLLLYLFKDQGFAPSDEGGDE